MQIRKFIQKNAVLSYLILTFFISWGGAFIWAARKLILREPVSKLDGILMFPIMILGPALASVILNALNGGSKAVRDIFSRMNPRKIRWPWSMALLIPPVVILLVLLILSKTVSASYAPGSFWLGFSFGILAGILEEIGWMGFAFPNLIRNRTALSGSAILGLIWGIWHLPVINFLGTASPHGRDWPTYFLSFIAVMTAMRVIIAWVYQNTESLLLCQLMHICSTGFLVVFSPSPLTTSQEPVWYFAYAFALWMIVAWIVSRFGKNLNGDKVQGKDYHIEQVSR
jgi:uncharacterized protein